MNHQDCNHITSSSSSLYLNTDNDNNNKYVSHDYSIYDSNNNVRSDSPMSLCSTDSSNTIESSINSNINYASTDIDTDMSDSSSNYDNNRINKRQQRKRRQQQLLSYSNTLQHKHKRAHTHTSIVIDNDRQNELNRLQQENDKLRQELIQTQQQLLLSQQQQHNTRNNNSTSININNQSAVLNKDTTIQNNNNNNYSIIQSLQQTYNNNTDNNKNVNKLLQWLTILGSKRVKQLILCITTIFLFFVSYTTYSTDNITPTLSRTTTISTRMFSAQQPQPIYTYNMTQQTFIHRFIPYNTVESNLRQPIYIQQRQQQQQYMYRQYNPVTSEYRNNNNNRITYIINKLRNIINAIGKYKWYWIITCILTTVYCYVKNIQ